jgi:hypothetical protein
MGWQQRSRRNIPTGTVCYLCGHIIQPDQAWNKDHVPPQRFYGKSIRQKFNPNLRGLHTHTVCNSAYKADEEYYTAVFAGHADSPTGRSVFADWQRGVAKGHDVGLLKTILSQFSKVVLADGSLVLNYDVDRAGRITWKLVRGLYFADTGRCLPDNLPKRLIMLSPHENERAADLYPWWTIVRDTEPLGWHGAVFDYKWVGVLIDGIRSHMVAMALWDRLLALVLFHDPTCPCEQCQRVRV